jgi:hypothetical protein
MPLTPTLSPAVHSAMLSMLHCCTSDLKRRGINPGFERNFLNFATAQICLHGVAQHERHSDCDFRGADHRAQGVRRSTRFHLEDRVPAEHPLRLIRRIVNDVLAALDGEFAKIYADSGRPSIPPERLLRRFCCRRSTRSGRRHS